MNGEYVPDFHERGEAFCEMFVVGNKTRCASCGRLVPMDEQMEPAGPSPYAAPLCQQCFLTPEMEAAFERDRIRHDEEQG